MIIIMIYIHVHVLPLSQTENDSRVPNLLAFKDGAYYCYCAYVLHIARYSGFLWVVPTNTVIFLRGLKLYGESKTYQMPLIHVSRKKIGVAMHFSEKIKL